MITKIRFQWGLHCSPNESPAYYHFQIIQDIKLNPRQIWCSYLFASKICVHFATQILERERFMIYSVFSDRTIGNHWSKNRILRNFGKGKYLVFLPPLLDNQICFWSRNVTSFELPLHTSQKHCGGIWNHYLERCELCMRFRESHSDHHQNNKPIRGYGRVSPETATEYTDWRYGSRGAHFHDRRSWELAIWLNWSKTDVPQHLPWLFHDFPETEWWDIELQLVKNQTRFLKRSPKRFKN